MIRRPPRSTLFPTRRSSDLRYRPADDASAPLEGQGSGASYNCAPQRSEEHTSELQSHSDLVCRLLLEKKNKTYNLPTESKYIRTKNIKNRRNTGTHTHNDRS